MPKMSSQWINHQIGGGWATDFGNTYYGASQDGSISIPWCKICENVKFYSDGSFGKHPGLLQMTPSPLKAPKGASGYIESSFVSQVYDYVRVGSSSSGVRERVAIVGSWLYAIDPFLSVSLIGDIAAGTNRIHQLSTFNDLLIIGSNGQPKSWDQTTFQSLAGTPPAFAFSTPHAGRHWASGQLTNPSRLYYSTVGNPEDWVGSGSGSIDIDPGDGDSIVALLSWKRELWVFKGPNRLSIHRITGTSPSDFARTSFVTGISAAGPQAIFPVGDDFAFWSPRGSCHSLTSTSSYGDYTQAYINFPILSWCRNPANVNNGEESMAMQCITDPSQSVTYCLLNNRDTTVGLNAFGIPAPVLVVMDWKFRNEANPYPRFIVLKFGHTFTSLGLCASPFDSTQLFPTFGTVDGKILTEYPPNNAIFRNDGNAFEYRLETPALSYGGTQETKTISAISVDVVTNFSTVGRSYGVLDFSYGGRGVPTQTVSFSNNGGVFLDVFLLDTDQLGSNEDIPNFTEAVSGDTRAFTYTFVEDTPLNGSSVGSDVRVKQFGILLSPSGESLENEE